jgi:hypothetical protein
MQFYWRSEVEPVKRIFATVKSAVDTENSSNTVLLFPQQEPLPYTRSHTSSDGASWITHTMKRFFKLVRHVSCHNKLQFVGSGRWLIRKCSPWNGPPMTTPNNSYKPIINTAWVRARLCKLRKGCTRLAAASDKFTSCRRLLQSVCTKPGKWAIMNLCIISINFNRVPLFYDWILQLFRQCGTFWLFVLSIDSNMPNFYLHGLLYVMFSPWTQLKNWLKFK